MNSTLILDTHILIWWLTADPRLSKNSIQDIASAETVYISAATIWELAIKSALGKFNTKTTKQLQRLLRAPSMTLRSWELTPLAISADHAALAGSLRWSHRDPFDRMLVAQARTLNIPLITDDIAIKNYLAKAK